MHGVFLYLRSTRLIASVLGEHECSCFPDFPVARGIRPSEGNRTPWRRRLADSVAPGQSAASPFRPDQCQGVNCAPGVWWPECGVGFHHPHDSFLITWQYSRPCSQHVCHHNYLHLTTAAPAIRERAHHANCAVTPREGGSKESTFTAPCVAKLGLSKNSLERICENMTLTPRPAADCVTAPLFRAPAPAARLESQVIIFWKAAETAYIWCWKPRCTQGERNSRACVCQTQKECCRLSVNRWCFSRRLLLSSGKKIHTPAREIYAQRRDWLWQLGRSTK